MCTINCQRTKFSTDSGEHKIPVLSVRSLRVALNLLLSFSAIAFGILCSVFISFNQILRIPVDREVYLQEQDNKLYTPIEYYLAISIPGTVLEILCSFILSSIYYWMAGFRSAADAFFIYVGFNMLSAVTAGE